MKSLILSVFLMLFTAISFANIDERDFTCTGISLQQLIENKEGCVKEILGNKIYLKPDRLSFSETEILLSLSDTGEVASITQLCCDQIGIFINGEFQGDEYHCGYYYNVKTPCPGCGVPYFSYCKNPNCRLKQR